MVIVVNNFICVAMFLISAVNLGLAFQNDPKFLANRALLDNQRILGHKAVLKRSVAWHDKRFFLLFQVFEESNIL
jgi:hypothetical protein